MSITCHVALQSLQFVGPDCMLYLLSERSNQVYSTGHHTLLQLLMLKLYSFISLEMEWIICLTLVIYLTCFSKCFPLFPSLQCTWHGFICFHFLMCVTSQAMAVDAVRECNRTSAATVQFLTLVNTCKHRTLQWRIETPMALPPWRTKVCYSE